MSDIARTAADPMRARVAHIISRARDGEPRYGKRFTPEQMDALLAYAATIPDEVILNDWHQTGPAVLRWIRRHQPNTHTTLAAVMMRTGWHVELLWNEAGGWFTARLVALVDREGKRGYEGGYLVPYEDPIGCSGRSPDEALANLHERVLEWA